jgi:outer membrane protein assembly factor BamB
MAAPPEMTWPQFRGPTGLGLVPAGDWPTSWDSATGKNILWKCPIAGKGNSSPVVWGKRVFVTTADTEKRWVHCLDAAAGQVLWSTEIKSPLGSAAANFADDVLAGYAAATPATDGKRVYVTYANADVAAVDFNGKQLWVRNLGKPQSSYGLASSPILYQNLLILQHDQGAEAKAQLSSILALDTRTGKTVWQTPRPVPSSWSTPIIIRPDPAGERVELITCGNPWAIAYDPATGRELWRADVLNEDVAATPVFANGLIFVVSKRQACAIRPGGSGEVTKTHLVWFSEVNLPEVVSPLANDKYYLQVGSEGKVTCLAASDGHQVWENDFGTMFQPSPLLVGDMVYLPTADGHVILFKLAGAYALAGNCAVGDTLTATPAFVGDRIYIRGDNNLYCIGRHGPAGETAPSPPPEGGTSPKGGGVTANTGGAAGK